jgi:DNA polymerase III subunit epsilon
VTFLAFDTETTGLFPIMHHVVAVGVVCFRLDGWERSAFQTLITPEVPMPAGVQQVHAITDPVVRSLPTSEHILARFIEILGCP